MSQLRPEMFKGKPQMVMVIDAPTAKESFRLYTHFNVNIDQLRRSISREGNDKRKAGDGDNGVFHDLVQNGKHKALTLARVSDDRARFGFEGRNGEIGSSKSKLEGILNMFVKVSLRVKKRIES